MNLETFYEYCLSKKAVTEHFPFDEDTLVFKVGGKMFALSSLKQWEKQEPSVNLKCDPERALELRANYDAINEGYHMSKIHWNTVAINQDVPDAMLKALIDHSYDLVFKSLTKKLQAEIAALPID
ncbi:Predicted DNA-binding protein, MmcQ/YjbR family [Flavobacterium succinicans]|uniref:Predicted DNA-binding protein, MmcQ/YjbR family n=1 Tax=Flavobacterium succinicans TaxID=29536 RepID=A0A1I4ZLB5_9FLAO|nr:MULTISPECIES: MmcQ/YjbR family DNA-binding protein [Flavobacterium]OOV25447.1 MmcQ-like protein [Flavobacterium sp. LM5]SFN51042.1 Predicted DNA-binding protein, MmcQ/YjbR family [Flavobacterium succinicans]